jgi:ABC-type antimicrobial peptide transport system permease subunit
MLANGLEETLKSTGSEKNVIILRKGADTEILSWILREPANIIKALPEIATAPDGKPLITTDLSVIINLKKKKSNDMGNVYIRGTTHKAFMLRPYVKIIKGKIFREGSNEIIVGKALNKFFIGCDVGNKLRFGNQDWLIVGIFEANGTAFESEIWGDVNEMMPVFGRAVYSTITFRLSDNYDINSVKNKLNSDLRLKQYEARIEKEYYAAQSAFMASFIRVLGLIITITFSIGSTIGAMITMYTSVANRTKEIGTLRALGFLRRNILLAFLSESILISFAGGLIGLLLSSFLQSFTFSTTNFNTFTELAFDFKLSMPIALYSLLFAISMGIIGGFFPAIRAARLNIISALRAP